MHMSTMPCVCLHFRALALQVHEMLLLYSLRGPEDADCGPPDAMVGSSSRRHTSFRAFLLKRAVAPLPPASWRRRRRRGARNRRARDDVWHQHLQVVNTRHNFFCGFMLHLQSVVQVVLLDAASAFMRASRRDSPLQHRDVGLTASMMWTMPLQATISEPTSCAG